VFLNRLDSPDQLALASKNRIRFGTGAALAARPLTGLEAVPEFPLSLNTRAGA
jgi:hypothetical protein